MISAKELNPKNFPVSPEQQSNLNTLLSRLNEVRTAWGKPMTVTSGLRTLDDHLRIYKEAAARAGVPYDPAKVPMASKHLKGQAADILDTDGSLYTWVHANAILLAQIGLWMEEDRTVPRIHFQIVPPGSGSRFFKP